MSENLGVHAQLTMDGGNFVAETQKAYRALLDYRNEVARLKAEEESLRTATANLQRQITSKTEKLEIEKRKLEELNQSLSKNASLTDAQKTRLEKQTAKVDALEKSLAKANKQFDAARKKQEQNADAQSKITAQTAQATQEIERQTKAYAKNAKQGGDTASQLKSAFLMLKGLALGYAGKTLFSALIGSNAEFEQSLTSFEVLLGSAEKAQKMMDELTDFAAVTPLEMPDVTKATNMLLGYGVAAEDVIEVMGRLGDLAQGNAEKLDRVSLAYGQMLAKGKVTGEELRQMVEAGVPLTQALADTIGVTTAEMQKMLEKGEVGIDALNGAITAMTSEGGKFFGMMEKQSKTMSGMFSTLKDDASIFAREVGEESFDYLKTELENLMATISQMEQDGSLNAVAKDIGKDIADAVKVLANFVKILWNMKDVLGGAVTGVVAFKVSMAGLNIIKNVIGYVQSFILGMKDTHNVIKATKAANDAMNASLAASPWGLVALGIGLVVGALTTYNMAAGQANEKTIEAGEKAADTASELVQLYTKYNELADISVRTTEQENEFKNVQEELISLLGTRSTALEYLTAGTQQYKDALNEATKAELENIQAQLTAARVAADEGLNKWEANGLFDFNTVGFGAKGDYFNIVEDDLSKFQEQQMIVYPENAEEMFEFYAALTEAQKKLLAVYRETNDESIIQDNLYKNITHTLNELKPEIEKSIELRTQEAIADEMLANGIPKTRAEYDKLKESVFSATGAGENYRDEVYKIADEAFPQFSKSASDAAEEVKQLKLASEEFTESVNAIQQSFDVLADAQEEFQKQGRLSSSMLDKITKQYPALSDEVAKYHLGLKSGKEILKDLQAAYEDDKEAFEKANQDKIIFSEEFYNKHVLTNEKLVNQLKKLYGDDYQNFQQLAQDKLTVETVLIRTLGESWSKYYSSMATALKTSFAIADSNPLSEAEWMADYGGTSKQYRQYYADWSATNAISQQQRSQMIAQAEVYDQLADAFTSNLNLDSNLGNFRSGSSKSGGSKSSGSKKDPQKEYEEDVANYKASIEDAIKADEERDEHERKMGRMNDSTYFKNMASYADRLRAAGDEVLNVEWMTYQDREKLRTDFIRQAELKELEYKEGYVGMADEIVEAEKNALEERFDASEKYIEDCNRENKWGEDNEVSALERILAYHLENFDERQKILEGYYADGTYTREQFEKRMDELDDEREEKTRDLGARIYDKAKEQGEEYFKEVSERIKEQYGKELEFEKEKWEAIAEYRSNAMLQEVERLENQLKKQTAKIDAQLEELADALEAFDRRMEDEHDDRKLKRLQYNLEYESDEDNRRSLEKEIEKLEEEIAEKKFKRDIADQQDALNEKKDRINEEMQYEIDAAKKAGDEMVASAKTQLDRVQEYFKNKMSEANIATELMRGLTNSKADVESVGEAIGELLANGMDKSLSGYIGGLFSSLERAGLSINRAQRQGYDAAASSVINNNNQTFTANVTVSKQASPAEAAKAAKQLFKSIELQGGF